MIVRFVSPSMAEYPTAVPLLYKNHLRWTALPLYRQNRLTKTGNEGLVTTAYFRVLRPVENSGLSVSHYKGSQMEAIAIVQQIITFKKVAEFMSLI